MKKHNENLWGTFLSVLTVGAVIVGFWVSIFNLYLTR